LVGGQVWGTPYDEWFGPPILIVVLLHSVAIFRFLSKCTSHVRVYDRLRYALLDPCFAAL
jgi:hypothetical protein